MAISVSQLLAYQQDPADPITTSAFDVPADTLLVVILHGDEDTDTSGFTAFAISDNQTPDLTFIRVLRRGASTNGNAGYIDSWVAYVQDAITGLTLTLDGTGTAQDVAVRVLGLSGDVDFADPIGAFTSAIFDSDPETTANITPETDGIGICIFSDWSVRTPHTSSDLSDFATVEIATQISGGSGWKQLSTGVAANANINSNGVPDGNYGWFEIKFLLNKSAAIGGTGGGGMTESEVVAGGKTLTITLTGDEFIAN